MEELLDGTVTELAVDGTVKESVVDSMAKQLALNGAGRDAERCVLSAVGSKMETSLMNSCRGTGLHFTHCQSIVPPVLTVC